MKPQPPVTRIRTARASSAEPSALADFPLLGDYFETWRKALAQSEWTPWLIIGLAAFLRFFLLGMKPPHFDEGINGWFVDQMVKNGFYKYDPTNYHGPLHFYLLLLSQTLFGRNLWALRLPVVLVSISCVWLTLKFEPFLGRTVSRLAALAMAVSPGFIFYGRYSIHEVWLVLFTMLFFYGLFGLWKFGTANYLWCAGMGLTGMILSKETYMLHVGCAIIAAGVCYVSNFFGKLEDKRPAAQTWNYVDLAVVAGTSVALIVFFYSGTFFHWNGLKGLYRAYKPWFETGSQGHGHEKPWYYWLWLISRYEWPALAGLLLCLFALQFKTVPLRYLAIYGVGTLMAYSIVKYKTPWCIISFIWPFLFTFGALVTLAPVRFKPVTYRWFGLILFGFLGYAIYYAQTHNFEHIWPYTFIVGAALLLLALKGQEISKILAGVTLCFSFGDAIWLNYFRCTTDTEPYVYVQTYNDIYKFTDPILQLAHFDPRAYQLTGHIIRPSPYPLPWMLGDFGRVGYYEKDNMPDKLDGDFLLVLQDKIATVESKLHDSYYTVPVTIRPYQDPSKAYFSARIFKSFFPGKWPDFTGPKPTPTPAATPAPAATPVTAPSPSATSSQ
ncbi:MAG TPA: flippase activity-associated protein Agl23 [Chthoniobacterales bacterium]|nr:flippase activity-associated protein Agl23 [Chthoniobacterales bacterium]